MTEKNFSQVKSGGKPILELTVFFCGALVMIYEITGSRLLSPFLGASTYVWTSLIGVILAALSLGYYLGGKWADRRPDVKILAFVIFLAGGLVSVTILLKDLILTIIAESSLILEMKSVIAALLLFAPASVLLGFVTPYAVKLKMSSIADSGKTVGRLYALSTVGSITGTFAAGFFLIPFVGSERTLYFIGASLIALSVLLAGFAVTKINIVVLIVFVLGVGFNELKSYYLLQTRDLRDIDTEYSRVQIFQTIDRKSGRKIRAIATDPFFIQSAIFPDSDEMVLDYARYYHLLRYFKPDFRHTLMIGGAGYSFPREYLRRYEKAKIDVVEIDPQMTEIARKFFRLEDNPRLKIVHEDGRVFLNRVESKKYDAVLLDAFGSLFSVPFQLTTIEAVREIERALKDDGIVIFNLGGAIKGDASLFLQAEYKTYAAVFPHVHLFKINADYTDEQLQNLVIVALKEKNSAPPPANDAEIANLLTHLYKREISLETNILTDDLAPVEYYNSFVQRIYRPKGR
ncbi:MAG TPA: fused MFS/spermidine synthase [Pyrinomonadaceae bacterium]|nr:fused MFS/spermidine synthase [Pyrinomonadaceae bacterium]